MNTKLIATLLCVSAVTACNPYRYNAEEIAMIDRERAYERRAAQLRAERAEAERQRQAEIYAQQQRAEAARRAAMTPEQRAAEDARVQAAAAERARQQQAAREKARADAAAAEEKKSRIMGGVMGALGGGLAAQAAGATADQTVGAAAMGASLATQGTEAGDKLAEIGQTLLGGSIRGVAGMSGSSSLGGGSAQQAGAASGSSGPLSKPTGVPGNFPTKPMYAGFAQACRMMTLDNYRTVALEKGGDVQLKTMCGQAFEYYHMYLNAIRQGYSEEDCNRTYAAHAGSARVAIDYAKR